MLLKTNKIKYMAMDSKVLGLLVLFSMVLMTFARPELKLKEQFDSVNDDETRIVKRSIQHYMSTWMTFACNR